METIVVYTSGVSKGNPGPAGVAIIVKGSDGIMLEKFSEAIGNAGADFAAYYAVSLAMQILEQIFGVTTKTMQFEFRLDNELVKRQLNNEQEIIEPGLVSFFIQIHNNRIVSFPNINFVITNKTDSNEVGRLAEAVLSPK